MDLLAIDAMNKRELVAELKKCGLTSGGNKSQLKIRLRNYFEKTPETVNDGEDDDDDASASGSGEEDTFVRVSRLEREMEEKFAKIDELRRRVQSSTNNGEPSERRNTDTIARRVETGTRVGARGAMHNTRQARVNDRVQDDEQGTSGGARGETVVRVREIMSSAFSFRDVGKSLNTYSGNGDGYTIKKWVNDIERSARMFKWNELQQLTYGKQLLKGLAKKFVRTIDVDSWEELKERLIDQFDEKLSDADVHKMMAERKKSAKVGLQEYLISMCEIGKNNSVQDESIMQYVINGIDDEPRNKTMLYGACTMREFRTKLITYEKFRNSFGQKKEGRRDMRNDAKQTSEKAGTSKRNDGKCYSCGEDGHLSAKCPRKEDGLECFACNEFGHRSTACPNKEKKAMVSKAKAVGDMYKTIRINDCVVSALIDTGCDLNLIREDAAECLEVKYTNDQESLSGLGGKRTTTLGTFTAKV